MLQTTRGDIFRQLVASRVAQGLLSRASFMEAFRSRKKGTKAIGKGSNAAGIPSNEVNGSKLSPSTPVAKIQQSGKRLLSAQSAPAAISEPSSKSLQMHSTTNGVLSGMQSLETPELRRSKRARVQKFQSQPSMQTEHGIETKNEIANKVVDEIAASIIADTNIKESKPKRKSKAKSAENSVKKAAPKKRSEKKEKELTAAASTCMEIWTEEKIEAALQHFKQKDPILGKLIETSPPAHPERLLPKGCKNVFSTLTRTIMGQQLAITAAKAIYGRFLELIGKDFSTPAVPKDVLGLDEEVLKSVGLSRQKASYVKSLAEHFESGELSDEKIAGMDDQTLITELTKVKGIGRWTVDMFAMFDLGHTDVLPVGDLGVRNGMKFLYNLQEAPSIAKMEELTECWRPYRSLGSFYMWHAADVEKKDLKANKSASATKKSKKGKKADAETEIASTVPL